MKIVLFIYTIFIIGCSGANQVATLQKMVSTPAESHEKHFRTNTERFMQELKKIQTIEERNRLMDEMISASNLECNAFLYGEVTEPEAETDNLYTNMFKMVGKYIGWDLAKDAIDAVSQLSDTGTRKSNLQKYNQALKPNILKAVQIARKKYLSRIVSHKKEPLSAYGANEIKQDLENYDKRCSTYYGLLEITNALEKAQNQSAETKKPIDVDAVTSKIKEVTEQVVQKNPVENNDTACEVIITSDENLTQ